MLNFQRLKALVVNRDRQEQTIWCIANQNWAPILVEIHKNNIDFIFFLASLKFKYHARYRLNV
ncbi:hypothetical protein BCU83_17025 [Vibrio breoganii]|uniref:Uncharacterized protein n=1 Tax=Vibrio breoganii TaxID=553239 RepID=A0AAN1CRT0_9VIBR|nr:hypothetical protein A6E01_04335 [Vibrio breoganii]PMG76097.1 hypothetical protein BCU83_17025 [Vibrio breoganii]PMK41434.1 hypothetical protein BCU00_14200 [Vibrio breoganii]PMO33067.1 hypothetical protein BCT12_16025 [Vibrio breoganii]PMO58490.1 hypothetical protein BCT07_00465 [Vibrio breoganii]